MAGVTLRVTHLPIENGPAEKEVHCAQRDGDRATLTQ